MKTRNAVNCKGSDYRALDRREFLRLGGAGLAGVALLGIASPALAETQTSAHSLGIRKENTPEQNRDNLVKALTNSNKSIVFSEGDYRISNSDTPVIRSFEGKITMEPGARFVFTDNTKRGLMFEKGVGARLKGVSTTFSSRPTERSVAQGCLVFIQTTETVIEGLEVYGSGGAGVIFGRCIRPSVDGAMIRDTMGDGLHFANCRDASVNDLTTINTGDDGLAFLNYAGSPDYTGGKATNVTVKRSRARGIAVVGQSNVTIDGFKVAVTDGSGLYCAHEPKSYNTRVPENVTFKNGSVYRGGKVDGRRGTNNGITISGAKSARFVNIEVIRPGAVGVGSSAPGGVVRLNRIRVRGAREAGFNLKHGKLYLNNLVTRNSGGTGIYIADCKLVRYSRLWSINSSRNDTLDRACSFERNRRVKGRIVNVADRRKNPKGNRVNASGEQSGSLGRVYDRVSNGRVRVANPSDLHYTGPVRP